MPWLEISLRNSTFWRSGALLWRRLGALGGGAPVRDPALKVVGLEPARGEVAEPGLLLGTAPPQAQVEDPLAKMIPQHPLRLWPSLFE
jgi:hypothetical protein